MHMPVEGIPGDGNKQGRVELLVTCFRSLPHNNVYDRPHVSRADHHFDSTKLCFARLTFSGTPAGQTRLFAARRTSAGGSRESSETRRANLHEIQHGTRRVREPATATA